MLTRLLLSIFAVLCAVAQALPQESDIADESFPLQIDTPTIEVPGRSQPPSPKEEAERRTTKGKILADFGSRMTPEFSIPEGLKERTAFWFDVYTHYGEAHHIIHHERFPWIVYEVVDGTETLRNGKGPLWLRRDRAEKIAKARAKEIRAALLHLAHRKSFAGLPAQEQKLYDLLAPLEGSRKRVFTQAARSVRMQLGQKDFFEQGLITSSRYLNYMEEEFRQADLPTELTRLPFVESSFNEDARSKVGASGIWQIMPATGRSYLIVNAQIDERNSPLKATRAAARLLRTYYRAMGSWPLAITAYNNGIGNIHKAIKHSASHDLSQIIARYHQGDFRFASSNFFSCFLAALYAEKYNELIFKQSPREPLLQQDVVRLSGATNARHLAKTVGLSQDGLLKYNPDMRLALRLNGALPRGYQVHLPPGMKDKLGHQVTAVASGTDNRI